MRKSIKIPNYVKSVMADLESEGFEVFAVGGCVRDTLLGQEPFDWDLCTDAAADEVIDVLKDKYSVIPTGIKHGTVTVISAGRPIETTTYRTDGKYTDGRHPENVEFIRDVEGDLKRRDFTINAMAYNEKSGLIDLFGGTDDLQNKIIRCVGEPERRFEEDALRIMRALRFSATLGFEIEDKTKDAMLKLRDRLSRISVERIFAEIKKLILAEKPSAAFLEYIPIFEMIFGFKLEEGNIAMLDTISPKLNLRLALLLYHLGKASAVSVLKKLKCDRATFLSAGALIENCGIAPPENKTAAKHLLKAYNFEELSDMFELSKILMSSQEEMGYNKGLTYIAEVIALDECYSLTQLRIGGADLLKMGYSGKDVGEKLSEVLDGVIEGKFPNERDALLRIVSKG